MPETIKIELSSSGITKALKELREYKVNIMRKTDELIQRLGEVGIDVINNVMQSIPEEQQGDYSTFVEPIVSGNSMSGVAISLTGDKVLFVEFSAGVTYGTQSYPLPSGDGFGAGTYPAKPDKNGRYNWSKKEGWWYPSDDSPTGYMHTFGNRAYMPMYHAEESIILQVGQIASEIFG